MGHQLSKHDEEQQQKQHPLAVNAAKAAASQRALFGFGGLDDVRSRTTETTQSSTPPVSPKLTRFVGVNSNQDRRVSSDTTTVSKSSMTHRQDTYVNSNGRSRHHGSDQYHRPQQQQRTSNMPLAEWNVPSDDQEHGVAHDDSQVTRRANAMPLRQRPSLPVKCPPSSSRRLRRNTTLGTHRHTDDGDHDYDGSHHQYEEDSSYLEQMYDLKSWDMFHRITQARKQRDEERQKQQQEAAAATSITTSSSAEQQQVEDELASSAYTATQSHNEGGPRVTEYDQDDMLVLSSNDSIQPHRAMRRSPMAGSSTMVHDAAISATNVNATAAAATTATATTTGAPRSSYHIHGMAVDDEWENLGLDYDDDEYGNERGTDTSESHLIFLFDL